MICFHMLGTLDLQGADGRHLASPVTGAKRLALLAYLALAQRGLPRRDTLVGLFWPEHGERHARNALSNMLHQIRRSLGPESVVMRGTDEVGLAPGAVWTDVGAFEQALSEDRLADAAALYRGDLLEGLHVRGAAAEFDQWLAGERERLRRRAIDAARSLTEGADRSGRLAEGVRWAQWQLRLDPYDEVAVQRLATLLDRSGDRAGAIRTVDEFAARLAGELEIEPSAGTLALVARIRDPQPAAGQHATHTGKQSDVRAIAVLPFESLTGTAEATTFAAGLHDDLLTELSRIAALTVIGRTSVHRYRGTQKSTREIGGELGVGTIVEGAVQTAGGRVRLNVQLTDVRTETLTWVERYDRDLRAGDVFDIQGELAVRIARTVEAELTPAERGRVGREPRRDVHAFRLYTQGRALLDQRTERDMVRSIDYFQGAIGRAGGYALAWSGLADALSLLEFYGHDAPPAAPDAMWAARRAVELGPELGETHTSLGIILSIRQDGPAALRELQRAVELSPSYAEAHVWLGWVQLLRGSPDSALPPARRAVELDPLAPANRVYLAETWLANGEPQRAAEEAQFARSVRPEYGLAHYMEGLALHHLGRLHEAAAALGRAHALVPPQGAPQHAEIDALLALTYAAAGDVHAAASLLPRIREAGHPFSMGLVHAALGAVDDAFAEFERVEDWRSFSTEHFRYFFPDALGALRADHRYRQIVRALDRSWGSPPAAATGPDA